MAGSGNGGGPLLIDPAQIGSAIAIATGTAPSVNPVPKYPETELFNQWLDSQNLGKKMVDFRPYIDLHAAADLFNGTYRYWGDGGPADKPVTKLDGTQIDVPIQEWVEWGPTGAPSKEEWLEFCCQGINEMIRAVDQSMQNGKNPKVAPIPTAQPDAPPPKNLGTVLRKLIFRK